MTFSQQRVHSKETEDPTWQRETLVFQDQRKNVLWKEKDLTASKKLSDLIQLGFKKNVFWPWKHQSDGCYFSCFVVLQFVEGKAVWGSVRSKREGTNTHTINTWWRASLGSCWAVVLRTAPLMSRQNLGSCVRETHNPLCHINAIH